MGGGTQAAAPRGARSRAPLRTMVMYTERQKKRLHSLEGGGRVDEQRVGRAAAAGSGQAAGARQ